MKTTFKLRKNTEPFVLNSQIIELHLTITLHSMAE